MNYYNVFEDMAKDETFNFLTSRIKNTTQSGTFLQEKYQDVNSWRQKYREKIKDLLFCQQEKVPFNEEITESEDFGTYLRHKVYFDSAPGCRIPAYLLIPKGLTKKAPGVVVMHDHGAMAYWGKEKAVKHKMPIPVLDEFIDTLYDTPLASNLAERGYVALVIDSILFGERAFKVDQKAEFKERLAKHELGSPAYVDEYNNCAFEMQSDIARTFFLAGTTLMGHRFWDDLVSLDFLASRPEVDSEKLGCIGLSMGAYRSGFLGIMDDRIKCAVIAGGMQRYREMMQYRLPQVEWMWTVPGLYGIMDFDNVMSLRAPLPLLAIHGKKDWLFEPESTGEKAIAHVAAVYEKAGASGNFQYEYFDEPHVFKAYMQNKAFSWMDRHLKGE